MNWWRSSNLQNSSECVHRCRESHSLVRPSSSRISFYRQHEDDAQVVRPNQRSSLTRAQKVCAPTKMHKVIVPLPVAVTDRHVHAHDGPPTAPEKRFVFYHGLSLPRTRLLVIHRDVHWALDGAVEAI